MRLIFGLFGVCFLPSCAESSKLHARGLARLLHPFADGGLRSPFLVLEVHHYTPHADEEQAKNAEREGRTAGLCNNTAHGARCCSLVYLLHAFPDTAAGARAPPYDIPDMVNRYS